ncbi:MAG: hypothetical protein QOG80_3074 [Pseudonocardiales bacterium]|nr:hypothetical protein [Pseudonocardiales bacterium]
MIVAILADGRRVYWCPAGSRRGGQDQWSPRASQALRYPTREQAEEVVATFGGPASVTGYEVVSA